MRGGAISAMYMGEASEALLKLRPVTFKYKAYGPNSRTQYGLIADEVAQVMPEIVVFKDNEPETVQYHVLPSILLNEYQRQHKHIVGLDKQVTGLEAELTQLRSEIAALRSGGVAKA